jgi:TetR/AcrR family transcriptional repressor of nem operon
LFLLEPPLFGQTNYVQEHILQARYSAAGTAQNGQDEVKAIPYTQEHKARTRERIVESARHLFNARGFTGVSIDEIMGEAGLTRGGFYNHFSTKEELCAEVVTQALACSPAKRWSGHKAAGPALTREFITTYLSQAHFDNRENCCPLMALPSDVARGGAPVKRAYRQVLDYMVGNLEQGLAGPQSRLRAIALAALCIGGMAVARAVDDAALANEIREAAKDLALSVGGWDTIPVAAE